MLKVINNIAATIIGDLFTTYHSYNLRSKSKFVVPSVRTLDKSQNATVLYDSRFYIKDSQTLYIFKDKI